MDHPRQAGFCAGPVTLSGQKTRINSYSGKHAAMQVTRAADYAIRVMIQLAQLPIKARMPLAALARTTGAPASFLSKVLQGLCEAGFASSRRGQAGGFAITEDGRRASVAAIIEVIDGPITLNVCLGSYTGCPRKVDCPGYRAFAKAQAAMMAVLHGETIEELAARPEQINNKTDMPESTPMAD